MLRWAAAAALVVTVAALALSRRGRDARPRLELSASPRQVSDADVTTFATLSVGNEAVLAYTVVPGPRVAVRVLSARGELGPERVVSDGHAISPTLTAIGRRALVAWSDDTFDWRARFLDGATATLPFDHPSELALASRGDRIVVLFVRNVELDCELMRQELDAQLAPVAPPVRLARGRCGMDPSEVVVPTGGRWVVYALADVGMAQALSPDGRPLGAPIRLGVSVIAPSVLPGPGGTLFVWTEGEHRLRLRSRFVPRGGGISPTHELGEPFLYLHPVATVGLVAGRPVVAWRREAIAGIDADGTALGPETPLEHGWRAFFVSAGPQPFVVFDRTIGDESRLLYAPLGWSR